MESNIEETNNMPENEICNCCAPYDKHDQGCPHESTAAPTASQRPAREAAQAIVDDRNIWERVNNKEEEQRKGNELDQ